MQPKTFLSIDESLFSIQVKGMSKPDFDQEIARLNPEQSTAVHTLDGPVLVVAGPGSGKTQILSLRVANILRQTDTNTASILCLTFTDAAAVNMKERLRSIIGLEAHTVAVHTYHSFATEVMNQYPEYFFAGIEYQPADPLTKLSVLQSVLEALPLTNPLRSFHPDHGWTYITEIESRIGELKKAGLTAQEYRDVLTQNEEFLGSTGAELEAVMNAHTKINLSMLPELTDILSNITPDTVTGIADFDSLAAVIQQSFAEALQQIEELGGKKTTPLTAWKNHWFVKNAHKKLELKDSRNQDKLRALAEVYQQFQTAMHQEKLFDFDDMIVDVTEALKQEPELRFALQERYQYFLVDEFQDTSGAQNELLDMLIQSEVTDSPNIMVVGDDDQSIYKFQGASLQNILHFTSKYPQATVVNMTKNYRSKQPILDYAMQVIAGAGQRLAGLPGIQKNLESQVE